MVRRSLIIMTLVCALQAQAGLCSWLESWWSDATVYNGARTLTKKTYTSLEIHGAATLNDVTVKENVMVTGSTTWNKGSAGSADIYGALDAQDVQISGNASIKGEATLSRVTCQNIVAHKGASLSDTEFGNLTVKGDNNRTIRITNSSGHDITIEGAGERTVILNNSSVDAIIFENKGGVVRLLGDSTVDKIVNGAIEQD